MWLVVTISNLSYDLGKIQPYYGYKFEIFLRVKKCPRPLERTEWLQKKLSRRCFKVLLEEQTYFSNKPCLNNS